jgi:hypothetical protein
MSRRSSFLKSIFSGKNARKSGSKQRRNRRNFSLEGLEKREMFSVSSLWFSGNTLVVRTDNAATTVNVSQVGSNIRISEGGTGRNWDYSAASVGTVEFQGGAGNDRFVNYVANLPVRGFGNGGNDYLEGYNASDTFVGGDGDDTLVGYGGNDYMWGGNGNDQFRGMAGNDQMVGGTGNDHFDGGTGDDIMWGEDGNDTLLGGDGNDQLVGGYGNDHLNGQLGTDKHWGQAGNDVIISIDAAFNEYVEGGDGADILWTDRVLWFSDNVVGATSSDIVQGVSSFANGADRTLNGDRIADPTVKAGQSYRMFANNPLFSSSGPHMSDIRQGALGDCYLLAGLGAIAGDNPHALRQNVVDFNDGTYGVRLGNSFYRVDNDLPVHNGGTTPAYAGLGAQNSMWVAIIEKAFAHYRTGANSYASIEGGWMIEANQAFRSPSPGWRSLSSYSNATALANHIASLWNSYQAVTVGFTGATAIGGAPLVMSHAYTVAWVTYNSSGAVVSITLRNPWGVDGAGNMDGNPNDGYVTVTPAQIFNQVSGAVNWGRV